ncbi:hypothetical protein DVDV_0899 [Desulfovibrio sp. DV]|nr:hypothetical protein DVDV_0899 [Desulfovibrio sp. DV]
MKLLNKAYLLKKCIRRLRQDSSRLQAMNAPTVSIGLDGYVDAAPAGNSSKEKKF